MNRSNIAFDEFGREIPDDTPVELPLNMNLKSESHVDMITRIVAQQISARADDQGYESLEESDDFDLDDDLDELTQYTVLDMKPELLADEDPDPERPLVVPDQDPPNAGVQSESPKSGTDNE